MRGQKRKQRGITLIALVITIIVLLILAGVSINLVLGENGILEQAQGAVTENEKARINELKQMTIAEAAMNINGTTYESDGKTAIIPAGFAVSENEKEQSINNGLVVLDENGNEFVWIPVAIGEYARKVGTNNWGMTTEGGNSTDITAMVQGDTLGLTNILGTTVTGTLQNTMPEKSIIEDAGGFYVSRYEMGIESVPRTSGTQSGWTIDKIYSKPGLEPIRNIKQNVALGLANTWKSEAKVQSGLITGTQWDVMCNYMDWSKTNGNCTTWGNYYNNPSQEYNSIFASSDGSTDWTLKTNFSRAESSSTARYVFPTGKFVSSSGVTTYIKNIADVAGNVWEWTTEIPCYSSSNAVARGGTADYGGGDRLATSRYGHDSATDHASWNLGFRIVLYVK